MRKAQIQSQIFIYVIAIAIFAFILVYGYNAIRGFGEKSDQISYIKFKTDLTSTVKRVAPDFGTVKRQEFFIGGDFQQVCFVQTHSPPEKITKDIAGNPITNPIIKDAVTSGSADNTFLISSSVEESFNIGNINVSPSGFDCIDILNGKVKIQFEGGGDHALIQRVN